MILKSFQVKGRTMLKEKEWKRNRKSVGFKNCVSKLRIEMKERKKTYLFWMNAYFEPFEMIYLRIKVLQNQRRNKVAIYQIEYDEKEEEHYIDYHSQYKSLRRILHLVSL